MHVKPCVVMKQCVCLGTKHLLQEEQEAGADEHEGGNAVVEGSHLGDWEGTHKGHELVFSIIYIFQ